MNDFHPPSPIPDAVARFIALLPEDRRATVEAVRNLIVAHLPEGYEEVVSAHMIVYQVPLALYPDTYNRRPLWYVSLASEKSYLSLHLVPVYGDTALLERLREGFRAEGKRLDMGKACVRFRRVEDLALNAVAEVVGAFPMERWIGIAKAARKTARP